MTPCIPTTWPTYDSGYGYKRVDGRLWLHHRWVWAQANGPIPDGVIIRHVVCGNTWCINIEHLAPGTPKDNADDRERDGRTAKGVRNFQGAKTHCKYGHEFTPENTARRGPKGVRACRECERRRAMDHWKKKKSELLFTQQRGTLNP